MVHGRTTPGFEPLADALAEAQDAAGERGLALAVTLEGELVVDLWTGEAAPGRAWARDTLSCVFSVTKSVAAMCAALLHDEGLLDVEAPVARYWPAFGKPDVKVRHVLQHTSGLVLAGRSLQWVVRDVPPSVAEIREALEQATPESEPGSAFAYHALTYGFIVGELVRRIDGRTLGGFVREVLLPPLHIGDDLFVGLPAREHHRCTRLERATTAEPDLGDWLADRMAIPAWREAEVPGGNGFATARALAELHAPLAQEGGSLLSPAAVARFGAASSGDGFMGLGFHTFPGEAQARFGVSERAFGHAGAGGSLAFADPGRRVSFGLTKNRMLGSSATSARLARALDACLREL